MCVKYIFLLFWNGGKIFIFGCIVLKVDKYAGAALYRSFVSCVFVVFSSSLCTQAEESDDCCMSWGTDLATGLATTSAREKELGSFLFFLHELIYEHSTAVYFRAGVCITRNVVTFNLFHVEKAYIAYIQRVIYTYVHDSHISSWYIGEHTAITSIDARAVHCSSSFTIFVSFFSQENCLPWTLAWA